MSIKLSLDGFLLQMLLRSPREYILKELFFSISVNSGRIFWHYSPRFQRIIVNNCNYNAELFLASCSSSSYVGVVAKKAERKCQETSPILGPIHFQGAATAAAQPVSNYTVGTGSL